MMKRPLFRKKFISLKHLFIGSVVHFGQPSCPGAAQMFYKVLLHTNNCLVWFLFYGPSTHFRSFRARSVNLATLFLDCYSWISRRRRMAVEMFLWPSLHERMCRTWGSNSGPLACQANSLPIELPRPVTNICVRYVTETVLKYQV